MRRTSIGSADLDAETLQTDVMRFMAILSFCLMAILALVRNVDSLPGPAPTKPEPSASRASANEEPSASRASANEEPSASRVSANEEPSASRASASEEPVRSVQPPRPPPDPSVLLPLKEQPAAPVPSLEKPSLEPPPAKRPVPVERQPLAKLEPTPAMPPPPRPSPPAAVKPAPATAAEAESLILRFASDTDFLKLVSRAVVEVYAYDAAATFKLTPGLTFAAAPRPPKVHELLEETIPPLVREALSRTARAAGGALVWGVHLPPEIESSIERHLAQQRTGVLLIDRDGSVRHVSSS